MTLATIPKFLVGNRQAIHDIARSRSSIPVGLMLVLSAGFAREYDAEYLVKEPWHVVISLAASLIASFLFFAMTYGIGKRRGIKESAFFSAYWPFLALFWMTAPLAWLYAIPFERLWDPIDATSANLWTLKLVSLWRVALMTRVVAVFFGCSLWAALFCVMLVADSVMLTALAVAPLPVIQLMGGIRLSDTAAIVASTAFTMQFFGTISMLAWIIGVLVVVGKKEPPWALMSLSPRAPAKPATLCIAMCTVLVWFIVLPYTQAEQRARYDAEQLLLAGQVPEGLALMSRSSRSAYPPLWDPPPRPDFRVYKPKLTDVMLSIIDEPPADWVAQVYGEKFRRSLGIGQRYSRMRWWNMDPMEFDVIVTILEQIPEGPSYASEIMDDIKSLHEELGEATVERLRVLSERE